MVKQQTKIIFASDLVNKPDFKTKSSNYIIPVAETAAGKLKDTSSNLVVREMSLGETPYANGKMEGLQLSSRVGKAMFAEYFYKDAASAKEYAESVSIEQDGKKITMKESFDGIIVSARPQSFAKSMSHFAKKEALDFTGSLKEDGINTGNTDSLYVTFLHQSIYGDIGIDVEKYMKLVNVNEDLMKGGLGRGSVQIPKIVPGVATALGEGGEIVYFGNNTSDIEIKCSVKAIGTKLTWEIMHRGLDGVAKIMLRYSSNGLIRKIGTDIVNTLGAGASNTETGGVTYDNIIDARAKVNSAKYNGIPYSFQADKLVIDVLQYATLQKSTDYKNTVYRAAIVPGEKVATLNRPVIFFGDLEIVEVNLLDTTNVCLAMVLDSRFAGIFVKESDYLTFEHELPNTFGSKELVLGMSYGVGVLFGSSITKITA